MKAKATSFDIAYHAGVSQSTVSRALRNSPLVSESTRKKIQQIARDLNYKVDKNASNLRSQHTGTIALLLFEDPTADDSMINPFFMAILGSITRACAQRNYDLLVSFQQLSDDWHADYADTNKADGLILLGYGDYLDYEEKLLQLTEQGTRFVRWGEMGHDHPGISVGCDNIQGGYSVTKHLTDLGREYFAFLGSASEHAPEFLDRYKGHCNALTESGLGIDKDCQINAISTEDAGYEAAKKLMAMDKTIDAIVTASDLIAIGAIRALTEEGIKVPQDVSVVGFDDIQQARYCNPPLTTVKQNTVKAGEVLVDTLLSSIHDQQTEPKPIPTQLIVRESCGV